MSKLIRIRLYRVQDYDLFALYYDKQFKLSKLFYMAASAYANGNPLPTISLEGLKELPKPVKNPKGEIVKESGVKFTLVMAFSVPDYDKKTLELLEYLAARNTVNSFVKTLVRRCFVNMECMYMDETDRERFKDPGSMSTMVVQNNVKKQVRPRQRSANKKKNTTQQIQTKNESLSQPTVDPFRNINSQQQQTVVCSQPDFNQPIQNIPKSTHTNDSTKNININQQSDLFAMVQGFEM